MRERDLGSELDSFVEAHLAGLLQLPPGQQDLLAHAVNERLDEILGGAREEETSVHAKAPASRLIGGIIGPY